MARNQQTQTRSSRDDMPRQTAIPAELSYPDIAREYEIDKPLWQALRNLYPGAQENSIVMVYEYCKVRGLDPLKKPVHIVPMSVKNATTDRYEMRDVIMPGIQEMRTTAARTGEYAGMDPPVLGPMIEVALIVGETTESPIKLTVPASVTTTVYRLVQGKRYPFTHTEYFVEAVARTRDGKINDMWKKRPIGQCSKCSEAGALRKAFPEELGGEYAAEEMEGRLEELGAIDAAPEHGASGIPEPQTKAAAAQQDEGADEPEQAAEPAQDEPKAETTTKAAEPAKAEPKPKAAAKPKAEPKAKAEPASEPPPSGFAIDLPDGARRVLTTQLTQRGVSEEQLLAKMGEDIKVTNINTALGVLKSWGDA